MQKIHHEKAAAGKHLLRGCGKQNKMTPETGRSSCFLPNPVQSKFGTPATEGGRRRLPVG
ncbi:MAG: hypothetical protein C6P37_04550 [Caldibacillus debilis]|uniref:Uncharacterized protein n=1 Tax=Caldibacillus debilis TaxID=301148 RepID=A0A3E0K6V8_9BACI|nr:MAG: hypothetical protein C6P37_04550 [Caldibacillus debilis]